MNANLNINAYVNHTYRTSEDIRREYLINSRRRELSLFVQKLLSNPTVWKALLTVKVVIGISCVIGLFSLVNLIESGSISALGGILSALLIAATECLCFIPIGEKPNKK